MSSEKIVGSRSVPEEILDATCGGRSIWHPENKQREDTLYIDIREEAAGFVDQGFNFDANPGYEIAPDEQQDFRELPYIAESFNLVVFDPPHPIRPGGMAGITGATHRKWGCLHAETWQDDLRAGFSELWRVLRPGGTLVFKFNDESADFRDVLELAPAPPLFGTSVNDGRTETRWFVFYKPENGETGDLSDTDNGRDVVTDGAGRYARSFRQSDVTFRLRCQVCESEFFRALEGDLQDEAEQFDEVEDRCEFCDVDRALEVIAP